MLIRFEKEQCKLGVFLDDKRIYTVDDSSLAVGIGENSFKMSHGSFKIHDTVLLKTAVVIKDIETNGRSATLITRFGKIFLEAQNSRIKVSFEGFDEYNRLFLILPAKENEKVYGSGEIFSEFFTNKICIHISAVKISRMLYPYEIGIFRVQRLIVRHNIRYSDTATTCYQDIVLL